MSPVELFTLTSFGDHRYDVSVYSALLIDLQTTDFEDSEAVEGVVGLF